MANGENKSAEETRCGYVAVVGRPNVGKSTLLNRILGRKVAIVTPKPQTTRNRILAVHNMGQSQIVFMDTPGLHQPKGPLGRYMIRAAKSAISEADVCIWIIDTSFANRPDRMTEEERSIADQLSQTQIPVLAALNKIDVLSEKKYLLPLMEDAGAIPGVKEVIPMCALSGEGVDLLLDRLVAYLPHGPKLYPEDMLSDQAERFFVAELIRESLIDLLRQELPYCSAVIIDKFVEEPRRCAVYATIHVERASQRAIVIGHKGGMIKEIGRRSRTAASEFMGCPVDLKLHVDVSPGWTKDIAGIKKMGYE